MYPKRNFCLANYSRSVLKSNGLHRPKIRLKKFSFSLKIVPAYISKKLPSQRCSQPFLIPLFNFSHKRPTFAFTGESGYTLGFRRKIAHKGSHTETGGRFGRGALLLPSARSVCFGNPAWPGFRTANFAAFGPWLDVLPKNAEGLRNSDALMRVAVPRRRGPAGLRRPTPPAERTVLAPISPRVQLCLRRPAFPLSAFIPGA